MHIATISSQRQITLPKVLLDQMSLDLKDRVQIVFADGNLVIKPEKIKAADLIGSLGSKISASKMSIPFQLAKAAALKKIGTRTST